MAPGSRHLSSVFRRPFILCASLWNGWAIGPCDRSPRLPDEQGVQPTCLQFRHRWTWLSGGGAPQPRRGLWVLLLTPGLWGLTACAWHPSEFQCEAGLLTVHLAADGFIRTLSFHLVMLHSRASQRKSLLFISWLLRPWVCSLFLEVDQFCF